MIYCATLGPRLLRPSPDNHYVHLAQSWLSGQLHQIGSPPGTNDWACFDTLERRACPNNRFSFSGDEAERYRFYVSFPPLPAAVILPAVAVFGTSLPDRLFWALLAGLAPALLFVLLRFLRESGKSGRSVRDDLLLTLLFAFGSVYYFTAVQGTVWFAAHVVASALLALYLIWGIDARRPLLAGLALGLAFLTRPTTALLAVFFGLELLRVCRREGESRGVDWPEVRRRLALFSAPILALGGLAMWMNHARFGDPFEFGHSYLQIRWRPRIETWGLFNYHYLGRNLAVFLASLPWLMAASPYVMISRHGLALWFTTPNLLLALWPKRVTTLMFGLFVSILPVVILNLMYQNSGWVQFGYRFALDYLIFVFALLALSGRRFGLLFVGALVFSIAINTFGAITFDRMPRFYDRDASQRVIFQPD